MGYSVDFEPVGDFVLLLPLPAGKTTGGIALPEGVAVDFPKHRVIKVGPGRTTEYGVLIPCCVKPGDIVYEAFTCQSAGRIKLGGKEYTVVKSRDIVGTMPQKSAAEDCSQACCARPEPVMAL